MGMENGVENGGFGMGEKFKRFASIMGQVWSMGQSTILKFCKYLLLCYTYGRKYAPANRSSKCRMPHFSQCTAIVLHQTCVSWVYTCVSQVTHRLPPLFQILPGILVWFCARTAFHRLTSAFRR
ncbi:hypothetical protein HAX54_021689 [Datura stramonium]|uniref:Uncharacterized protein n=1 Tax=Datura stramonium TaxID=4076 RepID=A0ABS8UTW8_DATST|nr:hypothetical protein [Datura stramonium]